MSLSVEQVLSMVIFLAVFLGMCGAALAVSYWLGSDKTRALTRLRGLSVAAEEEPAGKGLAMTALPRVGALLTPAVGNRQERLRTRLVQAGFYGAQAVPAFRGAKLLCAVALPILMAGVPAGLGLLPS